MTKTIERIHGGSDPSHAIIWLHGLGASANDFVPVIPYLGLAEELAIRFVFPQAPERSITINNGYVMPGWYDIKGTDIRDKEDLVGMNESRTTLEALIEAQVERGIPSENILLAGFSQGGAVAYYTGIRYHRKLAGILGLSTYLPFAAKAQAEHDGINKTSPILAMHGTLDPIVPIDAGRNAVETLFKLGYNPEWKEYVMEHNVIPEQLADIGAWLNAILGSDR